MGVLPAYETLIISWNYSHDSALYQIGQILTRTCYHVAVYSEERKVGMKISYNPDEEIVKSVKEGLERTGGYCPCRIQRTEDTKCMCKEFRDQIKDPEFEGFCHCLLYYKSLD